MDGLGLRLNEMLEVVAVIVIAAVIVGVPVGYLLKKMLTKDE